jgi:hypothetical protein
MKPNFVVKTWAVAISKARNKDGGEGGKKSERIDDDDKITT